MSSGLSSAARPESAPGHGQSGGGRDAADFHNRWRTLGAPQRPPPAVVAAMRPWVRGVPGMALQLGVTPEIARLPAASVAVDWNAEMIRQAWPGDDADHVCLLADWYALPLADRSIGCAFGDACLSTLDWPEGGRRLMDNLARVLRRPGRIVLRCFVGPDHPESLDTLAAEAMAGKAGSFGAFKLRFNMGVVGATGRTSNSGDEIHARFGQHVPDRAALAAAAGWSRAEIDTIDAYAGSASRHGYPTRAEIAAVLPAGSAHHYVAAPGYPLAERCPILVVDLGDDA